MRTRLISEAAFDKVAGPVADDDGAARIERRANDLARLPIGNPLSGLGIDHLKEHEVGIRMKSSGSRTLRRQALGPRELGLGEAIGGDDADVLGADLLA